MPYFPYSRQSKRKGHRGAITARMVANLMHVAGVNHVITIDLHASQSQGFFKCPVDNLIAEPTLAKWIKNNVKEWTEAVVVSKNPGGTKRVTSLADALKISFGIVTTDTRRAPMYRSMEGSAMLGSVILDGMSDIGASGYLTPHAQPSAQTSRPASQSIQQNHAPANGIANDDDDVFAPRHAPGQAKFDGLSANRQDRPHWSNLSVSREERKPPTSNGDAQQDLSLTRAQTVGGTSNEHEETDNNSEYESGEEFTDEVRITRQTMDLSKTDSF